MEPFRTQSQRLTAPGQPAVSVRHRLDPSLSINQDPTRTSARIIHGRSPKLSLLNENDCYPTLSIAVEAERLGRRPYRSFRNGHSDVEQGSTARNGRCAQL